MNQERSTFRGEFLLSTYHELTLRARRLNTHGRLTFATRGVTTTPDATIRASAILIIANTSILVDLLTRTRHMVAHIWAPIDHCQWWSFYVWRTIPALPFVTHFLTVVMRELRDADKGVPQVFPRTCTTA